MTAIPKSLLQDLFEAAVSAADPGLRLRSAVPAPPKGRTIVIGAGKAAAHMAAALEAVWPAPLSGTVVTQYGARVPCQHINVLEAAHPVPDHAGLAASEALFQAVSDLTAEDLVIALISGGGSSLLPAPVAGLELADEQLLGRALLASGAPISVMNLLRKQISRIKGGKLAAAAHPARVVTLIISDVPGDIPNEVASGPTIPGPGGGREAAKALAHLRLSLPPHLDRALRAGTAPRPNAPEFARDAVHVIASAQLSLAAAADLARQRGIEVRVLSDAIEGEARRVGADHARLALAEAGARAPASPPLLLLSGGETTVTLTGAGRGGRNTEYLLAFALDIAGHPGITALAADTDGIDGTENNAGAFADGNTVAKITAAGGDAAQLLATHDTWRAFDLAGDLFVTGPTGTNVNDFRAILIG